MPHSPPGKTEQTTKPQGREGETNQTRSATMEGGGSLSGSTESGLSLGSSVMQLQQLQKTAGNQAVLQMMKSGVIQRKPVPDPRHPGFLKDDKHESLKLKEKETGTDGETPTAVYEIRNQMKRIYWRKDKPDEYFEDPEHKTKYETKNIESSGKFGSWLETYHEAVKAQDDIDKDGSIPSVQEKKRLKDAISTYLLQKFIANALYRSEEIDRMDYQASPLNYQTKSQYMRSFATSFVSALQAKLPDLPDGRLVLTRTDKLDDVLSQFFQVMKVTGDSDINVDGIKASLTKTVEKSADYLLANDKDLTKYWEVPGNPQAFVDMTPMLQSVGAGGMAAESERVGGLVKKVFVKAVAKKMAETQVEKASVPTDAKDGVKGEVVGKLNQFVDNADELGEFDSAIGQLGKKGIKASTLADNTFISGHMLPFKTWLTLQTTTLTAAEQSFKTNRKATNEKMKFMQAIKDPCFKRYLEEKKDAKSIKQTDFAKPEAWAIFSQLKDKVSKAYASANMVVTTGGVVKLSETATGAFDQAAILTDDKAMGMAVKTAVNKSGNVPSPTEASRKLFKTDGLKEIVLSVMDSQKAKTSRDDNAALSQLRSDISGFTPDSYTSLVDAVDQLTETKGAFEKFKLKFKEDTSNMAVEAKAAIKLIEGSGVLDEGGKLPGFVLKQLQQMIEDATASQAVIEDYVRNIQGMHEACIFALEWRDAKPDPTYDYGAPKMGETDDYFRGAHLTDYGLKAFSQAYDAVVAQVKAGGGDGLNIEAFYNIYFELNDKLRATQNTSKDSKVSLESPSSIDDYLATERFTELKVKTGGPDMILIDIHPNDATKEKIAVNEVSKLIDGVFEQKKLEPTFRCSVIVDITLNHTSEKEVKDIREKAQPHIASGQLNLVFVQSLTKFAQLGMDKQSGGLMFAYNKADAWTAFNDKLAELKSKDEVDAGIQNYFQALFKHTQTEQVEYLQRVRANTKVLKEKLETSFAKLKDKGAIEISENTDEGTCYVSLRYDEFLARAKPLNAKEDWDADHHFNVDVLELGINKLLSNIGLPVAMRFSFGFPVSNLGEVGKEVRFTIGLEGAEKLQEYADVLTYVSGKLEAKRKGGGSAELLDEAQRQSFLSDMTAPITSMEKLQEQLRPLLKMT